MWVLVAPEADAELGRLKKRSPAEYTAMLHALEKLNALGPDLPYPHSSQVKGTNLRELRPRGGRSAWRGFYRRRGDAVIFAAIGPEAKHDPRGFKRAVNKALERLERACS